MMYDDRTTHEHLSNRNMNNRKPYRTKKQKAMAKANAKVDAKSGKTFSSAPVSRHAIQQALMPKQHRTKKSVFYVVHDVERNLPAEFG